LIKMNKIEINKLRRFGITMAFVFIVIAAVLFFMHKNIIPYAVTSFLFFWLAIGGPILLNPLYIFWMKLASVLSWINTRLILLLMFYLIFAPIGLILKLTGKDLLDKKIDRFKESYWKKKETGTASYERQF